MPRVWSWPRLKAVTLFNGGLRGKARDFNWHNVIGSWSAIPLLSSSLCRADLLPMGNAAVYRAMGEPSPQRVAVTAAPGPRRRCQRPA
jgi:hypothetical protein